MILKTYLQQLCRLSEQEWAAAASAFKKEHLQKGDYYIREHQYCDKISFIESGLFRLFYLHDGEERIMMLFSEQQFVTDYFGYLTCTPSIRPIQALEDAVIYTIRRDQLEKLYTTSKSWEHIGRLLAERAYVVAVQRANRLVHDEADTRFDTFAKEYPTLLDRMPQYMIASYLNMKPETLSRIKRRRMANCQPKPSIHASIDPGFI